MPDTLPIIPFDQSSSDRYERSLDRNVTAPMFRDFRQRVDDEDADDGAPLVMAVLGILARSEWPQTEFSVITPVAERWAKRVERRHSKSILRNFKRAGIGERVAVSDDAVRAALQAQVRTNVALVKKVEPWVRYRLRKEINDYLATIDISDFDRAELRRQLKKIRGLTESRLNLIANDQTGKLGARFDEIRMRAAGVEMYRWVTMQDSRVRTRHRALHGTIHTWSNPSDEGHPGEPIQCRCRAAGIFDRFKPWGDPSVFDPTAEGRTFADVAELYPDLPTTEEVARQLRNRGN